MSKQKYEQEIEEILRKYEEEKGKRERGGVGDPSASTPPGRPTLGSSPRPPIDFRAAQNRRKYARPTPAGGFTMPNWKRLSAAQYIGLAVGVAILAVLVGKAIPVLTGALIIASAVLFLVPFVLYRSTGTSSGGYSPTEEKRWRGQPIDYSNKRGDEDPLAGIKGWFKRR
jgi:hypothetical protein